MTIEFHKTSLNLCEELYLNLDRDSNDLINELTAEIKSCYQTVIIAEQLTQESANLLSDEAYTSLLTKIGSINLSNRDYLNILSRTLGNKFSGFTTIRTTMTRNIIATEGRGSSFDYWEEEVGTSFDIAYTEDTKIDEEHEYTVAELKRLIEENKIILIVERDMKDCLPIEPEEYEKFEIINLNTLACSKRFKPAYQEYVREKITSKRITSELRQFLSAFREEIADITAFFSPIQYEQDKVDHVKKALTEDETLKILMKKHEMTKEN